MLCSIVLLFGLAGTASGAHPAQAIMQLYASELKSLNAVSPYIVSILALNELEHNRNLKEVRQFIHWYFSKLNYPDKHRLTGTIYDYVIENGQERPTGDYDSVDGYAGFFLHLLHRYAQRTGELELLRENWDKIEDIAFLLPFLQDKDGLTWALSDSSAKYLMDNCEAYAGVSAYLALRNLLSKGKSTYYLAVRDSIKRGLLEQLYEPKKRIFAWGIDTTGKNRSDWNRFYPDAYAQLFPLYYGLLADNPKLRKHLWWEFTKRHAANASRFPVEQRIIYALTKKTMEGKIRR
jgi:hypothetical protein